MKVKDYILLFIIGATLGGVSGAIASTTKNEGKNLILWSAIGAIIMAISAVISKGRVLSLLFLKFDLGSPYEGHRKGEWKQFWIILGFMGIFVGSLRYEWIDEISDGMMYIAFPSIAILCFAIGYVISQKLKEMGSLAFGLIGLGWGTYTYLTFMN